jgi:hypothetical protein
MPRKRAAQVVAKGLETAGQEQQQQILLDLVGAVKDRPLAPWERPAVKPWAMAQTVVREIQTALIAAPGDSQLTAALGQAVDILKLDSIRETQPNKLDNKRRQLLNAELADRWADLLQTIDQLAEQHTLPTYAALKAVKAQQDTAKDTQK